MIFAYLQVFLGECIVHDSSHPRKLTLARLPNCRLPEFGQLVDEVLEMSVTNILQEAFSGDFNITARPRLVALPPRVSTPQKGLKQ